MRPPLTHPGTRSRLPSGENRGVRPKGPPGAFAWPSAVFCQPAPGPPLGGACSVRLAAQSGMVAVRGSTSGNYAIGGVLGGKCSGGNVAAKIAEELETHCTPLLRGYMP